MLMDDVGLTIRDVNRHYYNTKYSDYAGPGLGHIARRHDDFLSLRARAATNEILAVLNNWKDFEIRKEQEV